MLLMNYAFRTDMMSVYNAKTFIILLKFFFIIFKPRSIHMISKTVTLKFILFVLKPFHSFVLSHEAMGTEELSDSTAGSKKFVPCR